MKCNQKKLLLIYILFPLYLNGQENILKTKANTSPSLSFKQVMNYYKTHQPVKMNFKKTTFLQILKKQWIVDGTITVAKNFLEVKFLKPLPTRLILNQKSLWHITCPLSGKEKPNIVKYASYLENQKVKHLILVLFDHNDFSKLFRFVSSQTKGRTRINQFEPIRSNHPVKSLSLKTENFVILKALVEWKDSNSEEYQFSDIRFKQSLSKISFKSKKLTCLEEMDRVSF